MKHERFGSSESTCRLVTCDPAKALEDFPCSVGSPFLRLKSHTDDSEAFGHGASLNLGNCFLQNEGSRGPVSQFPIHPSGQIRATLQDQKTTKAGFLGGKWDPWFPGKSGWNSMIWPDSTLPAGFFNFFFRGWRVGGTLPRLHPIFWTLGSMKSWGYTHTKPLGKESLYWVYKSAVIGLMSLSPLPKWRDSDSLDVLPCLTSSRIGG